MMDLVKKIFLKFHVQRWCIVEGISYLLLRNKLSQNVTAENKCICYRAMSVGQELWRGVAGSSELGFLMRLHSPGTAVISSPD